MNGRARMLKQLIECYPRPREYATMPLERDGLGHLALFFDGPMGLRRGTYETIKRAFRDVPDHLYRGYYERPRFLVGFYRYKSRRAAELAINRWAEHGTLHKEIIL